MHCQVFLLAEAEMPLSPSEENINRLVAQLWQNSKDAGIWIGSLTVDGRFPCALMHILPNNHSVCPPMNCPWGDMVHYEFNANGLFLVSVGVVVYELPYFILWRIKLLYWGLYWFKFLFGGLRGNTKLWLSTVNPDSKMTYFLCTC